MVTQTEGAMPDKGIQYSFATDQNHAVKHRFKADFSPPHSDNERKEFAIQMRNVYRPQYV